MNISIMWDEGDKHFVLVMVLANGNTVGEIIADHIVADLKTLEHTERSLPNVPEMYIPE